VHPGDAGESQKTERVEDAMWRMNGGNLPAM